MLQSGPCWPWKSCNPSILSDLSQIAKYHLYSCLYCPHQSHSKRLLCNTPKSELCSAWCLLCVCVKWEVFQFDIFCLPRAIILYPYQLNLLFGLYIWGYSLLCLGWTAERWITQYGINHSCLKSQVHSLKYMSRSRYSNLEYSTSPTDTQFQNAAQGLPYPRPRLLNEYKNHSQQPFHLIHFQNMLCHLQHLSMSLQGLLVWCILQVLLIREILQIISVVRYWNFWNL